MHSHYCCPQPYSPPRPSCQVLVNSDLDIPAEKPAVEEIIYACVNPLVTKVVAIKDKVIVMGVLKIKIEYVACLPAQPVHFVHFEVPFNCFIDAPGIKPGSKPEVCTEVEYYEFEPVADCCKIIRKIVVLKVVLVDFCHEKPICHPAHQHYPKPNYCPPAKTTCYCSPNLPPQDYKPWVYKKC